MAHTLSYSDGRIVQEVIQVWSDLHNEQAGFYRAFWTADAEALSGSPVIGYCSPGGSHRTVRATVAEARRLYPDARIYRNGRLIK